MSDGLATVERNDEGGLIRFERDFPNSPDDVWSALTDADRLADWWPPFATNVHVDLRVGGTMELTGLDESIDQDVRIVTATARLAVKRCRLSMAIARDPVQDVSAGASEMPTLPPTPVLTP